MESSGQTTESPFAFIANRLRSIPLVSARMSREELAERQQANATAIAAPEVAGGANHLELVEKAMAIEAMSSRQQIGKRDASPLLQRLGERIQSQSEVLFRRNGITASTANVMRKATTSTTTTRRPQTTPTKRRHTTVRTTTTTTRRPSRTTVARQRQIKAASTTAPPSTTSSRPEISAKMMREDTRSSMSAASGGGAQSVGSSRQPFEPITSLRASTLRALAISEDHTLSTVLDRGVAAATSTSQPNLTAPLPQQATSSLQLTKATQAQLMSLTTLPVNQRRQQQPVFNLAAGAPSGTSRAAYGSNRFASRNQHDNDPLRGAGENWALFSRPDGAFSVFEILVLMSNVLIVSTVIFVILFNLIRSMRKKRETGKAQSGSSLQTPPAQQHDVEAQHHNSTTPSPSIRPQSGDAQSSSSRKSTLGGSGVQSQTKPPNGTEMTTKATANVSAGAHIAQTVAMAPSDQKRADTNCDQRIVSKLDSTLQGGSSVIANEIRSTTNQLQSKAMAIVQPSAEGQQLARQQAKMQEDEAKALLKEDILNVVSGNQLSQTIQTRPISRSVSDLSGGSGGPNVAAAAAKASSIEELKRPADDSTPLSEPDRVAALGELFASGKSDKLLKKVNTGQDKQAQQEQQQQQHLFSSLESIELPESLVQSNKGKDVTLKRNPPDEMTVVPSPNLLLGQVEQVVKEADPSASVVKGAKADAQKEGARRGGEEAKAKQAAPTVAVATVGTSPDQRPENPMGRDQEGSKDEGKKRETKDDERSGAGKIKNAEVEKAKPIEAKAHKQKQVQPSSQAAEVKNHQVVVNKLDKRKTNLEIVDLRDESVTGKMRSRDAKSNGESGCTSGGLSSEQQQMDGWISMDGVAVVQAAPPAGQGSSPSDASGQSSAAPAGVQLQQSQRQTPAMSPSEIIESRFHVDYASGSAKRRRSALVGTSSAAATVPLASGSGAKNQDSIDSKQEEYVFNNIENELEQDNKMHNRKYFVYIVHDGHFTAKKECIARIELPPKRRITLAELRQLISGSQDISLSSLRRNRFKFVTETYRLLNENEDAAVLHQVYPTQGVFLKLNVTDNQESQPYPFKGGRSNARHSSSSGGANASSSLPAGSAMGQTTISSRRRANARSGGRKLNATSGQDGNMLPAIEVDYPGSRNVADGARASSVGRRTSTIAAPAGAGGAYFRRSKSSVQVGRAGRGQTGRRQAASGSGGAGIRRGASSSSVAKADDKLPSIGRSRFSASPASRAQTTTGPSAAAAAAAKQTLGNAASDLKANMLSGAKKLFTSTFSKK